MTVETSEAVCQWIERSVPDRDHDVQVNLYGGEPLLNLECIRHIIAELSRYFTHPRFYLVTNGLGLARADVQELILASGVVVQLSLDGDVTTNDRHRRTPTGRGAYESIGGPDAVRQLVSRGLIDNVNLTLTPDTMPSLAESVRHIYNLGVRSIQFHPVLEESIDWVSVEEALCEQLALVRVIRVELPGLTLMPIDALFGNNPIGVFHSSRLKCGAGRSNFTIGTDGSVYPCSRLADDMNNSFSQFWKLGSVTEASLDHERLNRFRNWSPKRSRKHDCQFCSDSNFCFFICFGQFSSNGRRYHANPNVCVFTRALRYVFDDSKVSRDSSRAV